MNKLSIKTLLKLIMVITILLPLTNSEVFATRFSKAITVDPLNMFLEDRFAAKCEFLLKPS